MNSVFPVRSHFSAPGNGSVVCSGSVVIFRAVSFIPFFSFGEKGVFRRRKSLRSGQNRCDPI